MAIQVQLLVVPLLYPCIPSEIGMKCNFYRAATMGSW